MISLDRQVSAGSNDAEEKPSGKVVRANNDLELVTDSVVQTVGLRFTGVTIPRGATIRTAYIQFQADETQSEATSLTIQGQAADNAPVFSTAKFNVSSRPRTSCRGGARTGRSQCSRRNTRRRSTRRGATAA